MVSVCPAANLLKQVEKQAKRFFLEVPGFSKNMNWALNLDFISKQAAQKLKRGEFKNFEDYLNYFGESYQQFYRSNSFKKKLRLNEQVLEPKTLEQFGRLRTYQVHPEHDRWNLAGTKYSTYAQRALNVKSNTLSERDLIEFKNWQQTVGEGFEYIAEYQGKKVLMVKYLNEKFVGVNHFSRYEHFSTEFDSLF